jgi:hypothetical protein
MLVANTLRLKNTNLVKSAFLLALFTRLRRSVLPVTVVASVALPVDEGRDDATELTARRFAVLLHVLLAFLANSRSTTFAGI